METKTELRSTLGFMVQRLEHLPFIYLFSLEGHAWLCSVLTSGNAFFSYIEAHDLCMYLSTYVSIFLSPRTEKADFLSHFSKEISLSKIILLYSFDSS